MMAESILYLQFPTPLFCCYTYYNFNMMDDNVPQQDRLATMPAMPTGPVLTQ